jgi:hypothetical protein
MKTGARLECSLGIAGQFTNRPYAVLRVINEPFAAGLIYPAVLAAWTFLALVFARHAHHAAPWAALIVFLVSLAGTLFYDFRLQRTKPLIVNRLRFPASSLLAMHDEQRSALLLLGVLVNEANWLNKLLVKALQALPASPNVDSDTPEEAANLALTMLLITTLVGKVYEGWDCICNGRLKATLNGLSLPEKLRNLKTQLATRLSGKLFVRIRNNLAFHYADKMIDFSNFKDRLGDTDVHIYATPAGYVGNMLSRISTLAIIDPLSGLAHLIPEKSNQSPNIDPNGDSLLAYVRVLNEIREVADLYCAFLSESLAVLIGKAFPGHLTVETVTIPDAPKCEGERVYFFVHPPSNLEALRAGKATA